MDNLTSSAVLSARQIMLAQAVNSNNMANASTTGFRADTAMFKSILADQTGSRMLDNELLESGVKTTSGSIQTTGRSLDIAINGSGWIAVQAPDGNEAYTRRGDLHVDAQGQLTNGVGLPLLGNGGPIAVPPFSEIAIGSDGTISIQSIGQSPNSLTVVDRIKLVELNESRLSKGHDGLLRLPLNETAPPSAEVQLISGALEGSNVNAIGSMVKMIELARHFEMQIKLLGTADENSRATDQIMSVG